MTTLDKPKRDKKMFLGCHTCYCLNKMDWDKSLSDLTSYFTFHLTVERERSKMEESCFRRKKFSPKWLFMFVYSKTERRETPPKWCRYHHHTVHLFCISGKPLSFSSFKWSCEINQVVMHQVSQCKKQWLPGNMPQISWLSVCREFNGW